MATLVDWTLDASSLRQALLQLSVDDLKEACSFKNIEYKPSTIDTVDQLVRASMLDNANCRDLLSGGRSTLRGLKAARMLSATSPHSTLHGRKTARMVSVTSPTVPITPLPDTETNGLPGFHKNKSTNSRVKRMFLSRSNLASSSNIHRHGKERTIFSELELEAVGLSWMTSLHGRKSNLPPHTPAGINSPAHDGMNGLRPPSNHGQLNEQEESDGEDFEDSEDELHLSHILSPKSRTVGVVPWARVSMAPQYLDAGDLNEEYIITNEQILEMELNKKVCHIVPLYVQHEWLNDSESQNHR